MKLKLNRKLAGQAVRLTAIITLIAVTTVAVAFSIYAKDSPSFVVDIRFSLAISTLLPVIIAFPAIYAFLLQAAKLRQTNARLTKLLKFDSLTGLHTRGAFFKEATKALNNPSSANQQPHAVLFIDIDHFKRINDTFGHAAGDDVLRVFGRVLKRHRKDGFICGRIGGEEFAILALQMRADKAHALANSIAKSFRREALVVNGKPVAATLSIGVFVSDDNFDLDSLLKQADRLLYRAKHQGRNQVILDDQPVEAA